VDSTALTNLFGIAGVPAYYQPVKTVVRYELLGGRGNPWELPEAEVVFAKEMTGPCVYCEALFNPIRCLVEAGYPPAQLHLIVLERDPRSRSPRGSTSGRTALSGRVAQGARGAERRDASRLGGAVPPAASRLVGSAVEPEAIAARVWPGREVELRAGYVDGRERGVRSPRPGRPLSDLSSARRW
jgi:hypothetical protein